MLKNKFLYLAIGILCFTAHAQTFKFYIQIEDTAYIPRREGNAKTGTLSLESDIDELNKLFSKYDVFDFKQAFPTAQTKSLKKIYIIECIDSMLIVELHSFFPDVFPQYGLMPKYELHGYPDDYGLALPQGNLDLINANQAYDLHMGLTKAPIAVSDTYFDTTHEDLQFSGIRGVNNDPTEPDAFHGTGVCGAIAAVSNNGKGLASVTYRNPIYGSTNWGLDTEILTLAQNGYKIINCSWGADNYFPWVRDLYEEVRDIWDAVVICSAGNGGADPTELIYPASYSSNISVTSVGWETQNADCHEKIPGDPTSTHQHNTAVDICAPGYKIPCTDIMGPYGWGPDDYYNFTGTSQAAPQVAGVVSIIRTINPCLTADEAIDILLGSADNSIYSKPENQAYIGLIGTGRLDAYQASLDALESATTHIDGLNFTGTHTYSSGMYLSSANSTVKNGAHITFQAGRDITLDSNFKVELGGELTTESITAYCP